jgi:hypothetical protein
MVATSAAAAVALQFGGGARNDPNRPTVEQLREIRKQDIAHHVELVRELRALKPRFS